MAKGKKAKSNENGRKDMLKHKVQYTGENVTIDGNIITANGPKAAKSFGEAIVQKLEENE